MVTVYFLALIIKQSIYFYTRETGIFYQRIWMFFDVLSEVAGQANYLLFMAVA